MSNSRRFVIFIRLFVVVFVLVVMYLHQKKATKIKKQLSHITFDDFPAFFKNFITHKLQTNFIGLASNNLNCLWFVTRKNYINIEYEILEEPQKFYAIKLLDFAKKEGFKVEKTSYKNTMIDVRNKEADVYQIQCKLALTEISPLVERIYQTVFSCNKNTQFILKF